MTPRKDRWLDRDAGPVVRLYAVTQGRTRTAGHERFDLIDVVYATGRQTIETFRLSPEQSRILYVCTDPVSVADLASETRLPLGVVRVLLGDLKYLGLINLHRSAPGQYVTDERLLRKVLDGLRAL